MNVNRSAWRVQACFRNVQTLFIERSLTLNYCILGLAFFVRRAGDI